MLEDMTTIGVLGNTIILLGGITVYLVKNRNGDGADTKMTKVHDRINDMISECSERHSGLDTERGVQNTDIKNIKEDVKEIKADVKAIRNGG